MSAVTCFYFISRTSFKNRKKNRRAACAVPQIIASVVSESSTIYHTSTIKNGAVTTGFPTMTATVDLLCCAEMRC